MKKAKLIPLFLVINILFVAVLPSDASPAYALSNTDSFITDNDYELVSDSSYTVGTIESYYQVWIKPSACYPPDVGTPPCTGAFGVEYNEDSDSELYDEAFYDIIRAYWILLDPNCEEITDDVPGAEFALVYSVIPQAYVAIAYFGEQTGIFVIVAEVVIATEPSSETGDYSTNAEYTADGMKTIMINIGDKIADELNLPGFTTLIALGSLVSLTAVFYVLKKKRN